MKRGFTLAELLGVTVLLALIVAVSYPVMLNIFEEKQGELDSYKSELIETAAINYVKSNLNEYPLEEKQNSCVLLKTLADNNLIGYEVEEELYNRIVKVNLGVNDKYTAEILDEGTTCTGITKGNVTKKYEVKTCEKKDSNLRYNLIDYRTQYYEDDVLVKQIHKIKAENDTDLNIFKNKADGYEEAANALKYTNGTTVTMDRSESYFEMYAEFELDDETNNKFETFTDSQKQILNKYGIIFYDTTTESLDTTCS